MHAILPRSRIGPEDQGRRMSLKQFEFAEVMEGHRYELARGFIVVGEGPNLFHAYQVALLRDRLGEFKVSHPERIHIILGGMDAKLLIPEWQSERHPDLALYLRRPRGPRNSRTVWRSWVPEIVIEVVAPSSADRDYVEKREEYWALGVREYWIVDAALGKVLVLRRGRGRGRWTETALKRGDVRQSKLLPGFRLPCAGIFDAAGEAEAED